MKDDNANLQEVFMKNNISVKYLSFKKDSDIIIIYLDVTKGISPKDIKKIMTNIENTTHHNCIVLPNAVAVSINSREKVIHALENTIQYIKNLPDNKSTTIINMK